MGQVVDGATLGQIIEAGISPALTVQYEELEPEKQTRIGVLVITPDPRSLYVVRKELRDTKGQPLLRPGQSWGRSGARKVALDGEAITDRFRQISERKVQEASEPLRKRIRELEENSGPTLEVKRIRFAIEAERDWEKLEPLVSQLFPYAREFGEAVKNEVLDALYEVTSRTRNGMTADVAEAVSSVLLELLPIGAGGLLYRSRRPITVRHHEILKRVEEQAFNITHDVSRYLRDPAVARVGAHLYYYLIRFTAVNGLQALQSEFLKNASGCVENCKEVLRGKNFPEGQKILEDELALALDLRS